MSDRSTLPFGHRSCCLKARQDNLTPESQVVHSLIIPSMALSEKCAIGTVCRLLIVASGWMHLSRFRFGGYTYLEGSCS